jgi:hypothetical protein
MKRIDEFLLFGAALLDAPRAAISLPRSSLERGTRSKRKRAASLAVWVRGERIAAVGPLATLLARAGRKVKRVDLGGGTLTPGFTDSHIHLVTWIRALREPWLHEQSVEAIERAVRARRTSAPREEWLLLRGFVPRDWPSALRIRATLDRIAPDRPLVLHAVDGHSVWANGTALERAGIDARTPDPPGGTIARDRAGALTGFLLEEARKLMTERVERTTPTRSDLADAIAKARSLGITSAHDFDRAGTWHAASELARDGALGLRLLVSVPVASLDAAVGLGIASGFGGDRLRVGPVKMFADGTLGSATALLESPYEVSSDRGIEVTSPEALASACRRAAEAGLSVAIHAIGDRAVRHALDAIASVESAGLRFPRPPRIEHVQLSRTEDWPRFRALSVVASIQPAHLLSDRPIARRLWGSRTARSYAWKGLAAAGARIMLGSDAPFDRAGPLLAIQAALLRRRGEEGDEETFHAEQRIGLRAALRGHLEEPHRVAGWPLPLGRIAPGFGADLAHFDHDLAETPVNQWNRARVLRSWVGGEP